MLIALIHSLGVLILTADYMCKAATKASLLNVMHTWCYTLLDCLMNPKIFEYSLHVWDR